MPLLAAVPLGAACAHTVVDLSAMHACPQLWGGFSQGASGETGGVAGDEREAWQPVGQRVGAAQGVRGRRRGRGNCCTATGLAATRILLQRQTRRMEHENMHEAGT